MIVDQTKNIEQTHLDEKLTCVPSKSHFDVLLIYWLKMKLEGDNKRYFLRQVCMYEIFFCNPYVSMKNKILVKLYIRSGLIIIYI